MGMNPKYERIMYYEYDPKTNSIKDAQSSTENYRVPNPVNQNGEMNEPNALSGPSISANDLRITEDIRQAILSNNSLSMAAKNITIMSSNGQVTLVGAVNSQSEKDKIKSLANDVEGVKNVNNSITVSNINSQY